MISQLKQHQANQSGISVNSPKRVELNPSNRQQLLTQTIIHQTYGVQPQPPLPQAHILAQYQSQAATNMHLRQLSASSVIPSNYSPPIPGSTGGNLNRNLACLQMNYYSQQQQSPQFGDVSQVISTSGKKVVTIIVIVSFKVQQAEPRFPASISVNRLAPQV